MYGPMIGAWYIIPTYVIIVALAVALAIAAAVVILMNRPRA